MSQQLDPASQAALDAAFKGEDPVAASVNTSIEQGLLSQNGKTEDIINSTIDSNAERSQNFAEGMLKKIASEGSDEENKADEEVSEGEPLEEEEKASESDSEASEEDSSEDPDYEEVLVKGPNGRRQKLRIDYSDREKIKKAYLQAAGMRKAFQERDQALSQLKQYTEGEAKEKLEAWDYLQEAYERDGIRGLIEAIEDDPNAYDNFLEQEIQRREQLALMTPEERRAYELEQEKARKDAEVERLRQEMEEFKRSVMEEKEKAELTSLENIVSSAFEAYSFDGALNDPEKETLLNEMLWARGREALAQLPDDVPITSAVAKREFRKIAKTLNEMIKVEGRKQASRVINRKKKESAKKVQKTVKSIRKAQEVGDPASVLKKHGVAALFQMWGAGQKKQG